MSTEQIARINTEMKAEYVLRGWSYPKSREDITEDFILDYVDYLSAREYDEEASDIAYKMFSTHRAMGYGPEEFYKTWKEFCNWVSEKYLPELFVEEFLVCDATRRENQDSLISDKAVDEIVQIMEEYNLSKHDALIETLSQYYEAAGFDSEMIAEEFSSMSDEELMKCYADTLGE